MEKDTDLLKENEYKISAPFVRTNLSILCLACIEVEENKNFGSTILTKLKLNLKFWIG